MYIKLWVAQINATSKTKVDTLYKKCYDIKSHCPLAGNSRIKNAMI